MQQRNPLQRIWRLIGPLVVKIVVTFVVEIIVIMCYMIVCKPEMFQTGFQQEQILQNAMQVSEEVFRYVTEISALAALCTIPILAYMFHKDRKMEQQREMPVVKKAAWWKYIWIIGFSIPFALGMNNILILTGITASNESFQQAAEALYTPSLLVQIICVGIIIPIMEEFIFRGLLFKRMREYMPMMPAILYSGLFFGMYHGNFVQMIYGGICGMMLAYCYEKFGSLKAPVLMHMTMNILVCVVMEYNGFEWILQQPMRMGLITVVCSAIAATFYVKIKEM